MIFLGGCNNQKKSNTNPTEQEDFVSVVLKINMPLNFDDLDELFEIPITKILQRENIGSIIGDGSPIDEYGPYMTDIEFDIH